MGVSRNAAMLAGKLHSLTVLVPAATAVGLARAAATVEVSVAAASGPYRGHEIVRTRSVVAPSTALVRMTSRKAHLLDHDTHFPGRGGSGPVRTHGKFMWERGVRDARPAVVSAMGAALGEAMTRVFT